MKKLFVACLVALVGLVNAQENSQGLKGTWFATAQLGYSSNGAKGAAKATTTVAVPIVGTFIAPTTAVGIGAGVISAKVGEADAVNTTVVEPLVREYWPVAGSLFFFGQAAVPVLLNDASTTVGVTLTPGLDFVVNKWFTVEFSTTVASLHFVSPKKGDTQTAFNMNPMAHSNFGVNSQIGFKFLF